MSESREPRLISSAAELLGLGVTLQGVQYFRLEAAINEEADAPIEVPPQVAPAYGLKLRHEGREVGTRVSITLEEIAWKIVVDAAIDYTIDDDIEVEFAEGALLDFANNVGIMALLPYLRQTIADLSQRLIGEVVLMPIIPRGGLVFTADDADEDPEG